MRRAAFTIATLFFAAATVARAATLTIVPDQTQYVVGETITLDVLGDPQGAEDGSVYGRILFTPTIASYIGSTQTTLTSFGMPWIPGTLSGGEGFAEAFDQLLSGNPFPVDGPLFASVTLLATAPGTLDFSWDTGLNELRFFGLSDARGASITIVPEPSTASLVAAGLAALCGQRTRRRR